MRHTGMSRICALDRLAMFRPALRGYLYALLNGAAYHPVDLQREALRDVADRLIEEEVTVFRTAVSEPPAEAHYVAWARPFCKAVGGRIGDVSGRAMHLWHGEVKDRQYGARDRGLQAFDFDPFGDIALDPHGCWRWSSDKRALHAFVRRYFESRNEDGCG